ncbi:MAG: alpha/beta hydrolase fold domain-containing protein [Comamonadaceae bacterium]|jgi:epsilon-lactone hydrolase
MPSFKSRLLYHLVKHQLAKLARINLPLPQYRLAREAAALRLFRMPPGVAVQEARIGACRGEWLRPEVLRAKGIVLYLHGGAYTGGSCITHRALAARLASASQHSVFNLDYRLAPEHPFPAALDDALATYKALRVEHPDVPIALCGDSAGAGLALALAISLRDQAVTPPAALALMSPWTDLALTNDTHRSKAAVDPYFPTTERLRVAALHYAGEARLCHPLVSPQYAELGNLPATLIHVGTREALLDDSLLLSQRMNGQGSKAEVKLFPGMWHVWQTLHGRMREADQSVQDLGAFLSGHLRRTP